ncbi:DUF4328 domain-containing protein [Streptomyces sp. NBC_00443]|uniref:DUF4328 domain-containing protein n=1 Tax=Streptomyces sp. NBC_00443 TaxID=2975743 RepID=UPI002E1EEA32
MLCGTLAVWAVANVLAGLAAWNRYQLLLALPSEHVPRGSEALVTADMWLGNLLGWREAAFVISMLLLIAWLDDMRGRADGAWPQGQRRSRAWLIFAWVLPVGNLFIPKMFVNDLWAAGQPAQRRKRGHPLLTVWWLAVIVAFGWSGAALGRVRETAYAGPGAAAMRQVMQSSGLFIVAAVLTIAVVWKLSGMLERTVASRIGDLPGAPPSATG